MHYEAASTQERKAHQVEVWSGTEEGRGRMQPAHRRQHARSPREPWLAWLQQESTLHWRHAALIAQHDPPLRAAAAGSV